MSSSSLCHHFGSLVSFFFFNDTATTEIYTLSLHDALPISRSRSRGVAVGGRYRLPHCQPLHPDPCRGADGAPQKNRSRKAFAWGSLSGPLSGVAQPTLLRSAGFQEPSVFRSITGTCMQ